ncbi:MAG: membrane dipeptidase [Thermodesulfobacteriota bacterium]
MGGYETDSNDLGRSSYHRGEKTRGVTPLGRDVLECMEGLGMLPDLAHASETTFDDVLKYTKGPVMVSHTGVRSVHPSWRNINDDQIKAVAQRGGVIGIIYETMFLGGRTFDRVIDHLEHIMTLVGEEHAALGSDWGGCLLLPHGMKSASDLPRLTKNMTERGWTKRTMAKVLGENAVRLLRCALP